MSEGAIKPKFPRAEALAVAKVLCDALKPVTERLIVAGSLRRRKALVGDVEILYVPKFQTLPDGLFDTKQVNLVDVELDELRTRGIIAPRKNKMGSETWGGKNKLAVFCAGSKARPSGSPPPKSCSYCLAYHSEEEGCTCSACGCGLHPHFIRCAMVEGQPSVLCPICDKIPLRGIKSILSLPAVPIDLFSTTNGSWFNYLVCRTGSAENNTTIASAAIKKGWRWHPYNDGFEDNNGKWHHVESEADVFRLAGLPYLEPWER